MIAVRYTVGKIREMLEKGTPTEPGATKLRTTKPGTTKPGTTKPGATSPECDIARKATLPGTTKPGKRPSLEQQHSAHGYQHRSANICQHQIAQCHKIDNGQKPLRREVIVITINPEKVFGN
jgi:hypothetical protein